MLTQSAPPSDPIERIVAQYEFSRSHNRDMVAVSVPDLARLLKALNLATQETKPS